MFHASVNIIQGNITEMGVMRVTTEGLVLEEVYPAFSVEDVQKATETELIISPELIKMEV